MPTLHDWKAFDESPVFERHAVRDPGTPLDVRTHYVVGSMFSTRGGEAGRATYLVPAGERDPGWLNWLRRVEATQRPA